VSQPPKPPEKPAPQWLLQDAKGGNENFVLMLKSVLQRRAWWVRFSAETLSGDEFALLVYSRRALNR